jgi:hypothetical protein
MTRTALFTVALSLASALVAVPAFADPTAPAAPHPAAGHAAAGSVRVLPEIVIACRAQRPTVVVVVTRPTAAHEAGAAHEVLREALVAQSEPVTPKAH